MKVVVLGHQTWGYQTLKAVIDAGHEVVLAVTHPQGGGQYEKMWNDSVAELATEHGIDVHITNTPDEELIAKVRDSGADIAVANNWRTWLPEEIWDAPRLGTLNIHDSLLPSYAGFSPLLWALINGEKEVGVTAHIMDEHLDTGPIVGSMSTPVSAHDTGTDLFHRTVALIHPLVAQSLQQLQDGTATFTPQDLTKASFFHKRSDVDTCINWLWSAEEIERLVRAQSDPYPNAWTFHNSQRVAITKARVSRTPFGGTPGRIFYWEDDAMVIVAGANAHYGRDKGLAVEELKLADGTVLSAREYFSAGGGYFTSSKS